MSAAIRIPSGSLLPIRFIKPTVPPLEEILRSYSPSFVEGALTNSDVVARLEGEVSRRLGVAHCVAVSSCTSGLTLALKALGVQGEVILPSFTFFATGHAVLWNGLTPVFAECDPETWTIDPADVEARITKRTGAIIAVHLYGNPAPVAELQQIAARHGITLIYDAAHAFGSKSNGVPVGGFGDVEVFSLSPTKLLVAGEGGLVCTNDSKLASTMRAARNYGDSGSYDPQLLGLNARMTEFNAAMALAGLDMVDQKVARHNAIADRYTALLAGTPGLRFQQVKPENLSAYKDYSILISPAEFGMSRDEVAQLLLPQGITTKKYFHPPLHRQKLFTKFGAGSGLRLPRTDSISDSVLSLPIYESLPDETVERVARAIRRIAF
jgi:dTDP-4-amino-4,6-dideoxygalactose transaminase